MAGQCPRDGNSDLGTPREKPRAPVELSQLGRVRCQFAARPYVTQQLERLRQRRRLA